MNNSQKNRKKEQRQSIIVTVIVIMMMVAIVVAVATALAKNDPTVLPEDTTQKGSKDSALSGADADSPETDDVFFDKNEEEKDSEKDSEKAEDTEKKDEDTKEPIANTEIPDPLPEFMAPVKGDIGKPCSLTVPVFSLTMEDYRTHNGIDIYCAEGCDIAAAADGTVKEIWDDPMMGTSISIEHTGGAVSVYQNLYDEIPEGIEAGARVVKGQVIATAGDTALCELCEDSHLHFSIFVNGEAVDPEEYI